MRVMKARVASKPLTPGGAARAPTASQATIHSNAIVKLGPEPHPCCGHSALDHNSKVVLEHRQELSHDVSAVAYVRRSARAPRPWRIFAGPLRSGTLLTIPPPLWRIGRSSEASSG